MSFSSNLHRAGLILSTFVGSYAMPPYSMGADYYWTGQGTPNAHNVLEWNDPNNWLIGAPTTGEGGIVPTTGPSLDNASPTFDNVFLTGGTSYLSGIGSESRYQRIHDLTILSGNHYIGGRYSTNSPDLRVDGDFSIQSGGFYLGAYSPNVVRFYGAFHAANGTKLGNTGSTSDGGYWDLSQVTSITFEGVTLNQMTNNWQWSPQAWNFGAKGSAVDITISGNNVFNLEQNVVDPPRADVNSRGALQISMYNKITGIGGITKTGSATLILDSASSDYTGATNIQAGVLVATGGNAIGDNSAVTISEGTLNVSGGSIRSSLVIQNNEVIGSLSGEKGLVVLNGNTLTVGGNGNSTTFKGVIGGVATGAVQGVRTNQGTATSYDPYAPVGTVLVQDIAEGAGDLIKTGSGAFTLTGNNLYTGTTILRQGQFIVTTPILKDVAGALGKSSSAILWGDASTPSSANADTGNVTFNVQNASTTAVNWVMDRDLDGSSIAAITGRPRFIFSSTNSSDTSTLTMSGNITFGGGSNTHYEIISQQSGSTLNITGLISGGTSGNLRWNGSNQGMGTIRVSNADNSYAHLNKLLKGSLIIAGDVLAGSVNSPIGRGGLDLGGDGAPQSVNIAGGKNTKPGVFLETPGSRFERNINLGNVATYTSGATVQNGVANGYRIGGLNSTGTVTYSGNITSPNNANGLTNLALLAKDGGTVEFSGVINDNGNGTQVTRVSINQFVNHPDLLDAGANLPDGTASIGTVILTNANTYEGGTTVLGGTLLANNTTGSATGSGAVYVKNGATLGGTGSITGRSASEISLEAGTHLVVGATHGLGGTKQDLVLGNSSALSDVAIKLNGTLHFDLFGAGSTDEIGNLNYNNLSLVNNDLLLLYTQGLIDLSLASIEISADDTTGWADGQRWKLIDWSNSSPSSMLTTGLGLSTTQIGQFALSQFIAADGYYIAATLVPEPQKGILLLSGVSAMTLLRRRKS